MEDNTNEPKFFCESCEVSFISLEDHISNFHKNEMVTLAESEDENEMIEPVEILEEEESDTDNNVNIVPPEIPRVDSIEKVVPTKSGRSSKRKPEIIVKEEYQEERFVISEFSDELSLEIHKDLHTKKSIQEEMEEDEDDDDTLKEEDKKFVCQICNTAFPTRKKFRLHSRMHGKKIVEAPLTGDPVDNTKICKICNKTFLTDANLQMHLKAHKENNTVFPVPKGQLKITDKPGKTKYACAYCSKEFIRPHEKVKHERIHTNEKPYRCDECGKCFRVSYSLSLHKKTHSDQRPYVCSYCNKRFKSQNNYNHHLKTHEAGPGKYKCNLCEKSFKTSVQLNGHKNSHTKPFNCSICNRPFGSLYSTRIHMETHKRTDSNLKFSCKICGATYARSFALKDHLKEKHGELPTEDNDIYSEMISFSPKSHMSQEDTSNADAAEQMSELEFGSNSFIISEFENDDDNKQYEIVILGDNPPLI